MSFTTVRIDGSDYVFGSSDGTFSENPTSYLTYIKSVWTSNDIQVTQTLAFNSNPATGRVDVMQIRYMLENLDLTNNHDVGLRVLLDTMLGGNDGAPFQVPGTGAVTTEHEYTGASIPDYWQSFDDLNNPTVISQGTLKGGDATAPDRVIFVSWPDFYNTQWDYTITSGKIFGSTDYPDSSVGLYWNPITLGPGERIEYVTYYGLSGLSQSMLPPLTLSVTAPLSLDVVDGAYSPNPFTVVAYVQDISTNVINDVSISINLPEGLSLEQGFTATQTISTLNPNEIGSVSWSVRAANQANERLFNYNVTASASGIDERRVDRSVLVPALSLTYDTTFRSNPNGYQFINFVINDINSWDFFRNTFGTDEVEINGQPRPRATNFYNNNFRHYASGGSCFGMASSSSVLFQNSHDGWDLGLNRNDPLPSWSVFPTFIQTPTDWVEYYQLRWSDAAIQGNRQINPANPNDAYNEMKQCMAGGEWIQDPLVLVIWWPGAGHAVVPYRIEESADHQQANLMIYDNNFPDQQRTVQFNLNANTVSDNDYNNGNNQWVEVIDLSAIQSEPQMADYDTVTPSAHLLYTDSEGNLLGYLNDEFKNEIEGSYLLEIPHQVDEDGLETYHISNPGLKRELYGLTDSTAKVSVSQPSSLVIADVQVTPGSVDEISVLPIHLPVSEVDGFGVEFISAVESSSASRLLDLTLDRETTEFARLVRTNGLEIELESAVQLLFSDDLNKVGFINKGTRKNYNLYLEQIGLNPGKYTHSISIEIEDSSANWLTPHSWDDLDRTYVQLDRDIGNDGTIDNTEILTELQATLDIDPDVMNLKSNGEWITAYIELPVGYNVNDIDVSTINLITPPGDPVEDAISVDPGAPVTIGDHDNNDIPDMMVKFDRNAVFSNLDDGTEPRCEIELTIMGKLFDDTYFSGTDTVIVIDKKK